MVLGDGMKSSSGGGEMFGVSRKWKAQHLSWTLLYLTRL